MCRPGSRAQPQFTGVTRRHRDLFYERANRGIQPALCTSHLLRLRIWPSFSPSGRLCEEERCGSGFSLDRLGTMSEQWQGGLPRRRRTSLQRRIVAALIVEERGRAFERGCGGKLGGQSCHLRKVEAPDALCAPVPNAFGGRSSLPPAPDLGSGVSCIVRARARGSGISFSLAPSALCLAPPKNSS